MHTHQLADTFTSPDDLDYQSQIGMGLVTLLCAPLYMTMKVCEHIDIKASLSVESNFYLNTFLKIFLVWNAVG